MPVEPASSPSPHSTAEAGAPVLSQRPGDSCWNQRKKRLVVFEVLLHALRQPAQSGEEPCRASWEPTWPYQVQVQRCFQSELGFCHLQPKNVLRPETISRAEPVKKFGDQASRSGTAGRAPISGLSLSSFADRQ